MPVVKPAIYLLRFAAFLLIIVAVVRKNLGRAGRNLSHDRISGGENA